MAQPHKGEAYEFYIALTDFEDPSKFVSPTPFDAADFKISKAGGTLANLATIPVVSPASSFNVKVNLSQVEMTGADKVSIIGKDVSGDEWKDIFIFIDIPDGNAEKSTEILLGDHVESRDRLIINKQGTTIPVLDKSITGSLLSPNVTVRTLDT